MNRCCVLRDGQSAKEGRIEQKGGAARSALKRSNGARLAVGGKYRPDLDDLNNLLIRVAGYFIGY
ncbi:MAG: hypothetical protein L0Y43_05040 [Methylococcaceae bacterium]|nr:hypothetical protein [Methylococcaceae bacterium]